MFQGSVGVFVRGRVCWAIGFRIPIKEDQESFVQIDARYQLAMAPRNDLHKEGSK